MGDALGYKIHVVYNALAHPADRNYQSRSENNNPLTLSWDIDAVAALASGINPTAHIVIDSRKYAAEIVAQIEDILYGDSDNEARLPMPSEIQTIIQQATTGYGHGLYGHTAYGH